MPILSRMSSPDNEVDHRRVPRQRLNDGPPGRSQRVFDISRYGCQIESNDLSDGASGQFIEIDFGSHITRAIIRWADRARLGVEFTRPLGSGQVEALMAEPAPIRLRRL